MTLNNSTVVAMQMGDFRKHLRKDGEGLSYSTLNRYRRAFVRELKHAETDKDIERGKLADAKIRVVEKRMRKKIESGDDTVQRRKSGTGKKVVKQFTYKDTPHNRKLERVGQTYEKAVYEDAEFEPKSRKFRRRKRPLFLAGEEAAERRVKAQKNNKWIRAVSQAKEELGAPGFIIIRKEPRDPSDPDQVMGSKVYARATELMRQFKAEAAQVKEEPVEADAAAKVEVDAQEPAPKRRRRTAKV